MSVYAVIVCDRCGDSLTGEDGHLAIENEARDKGWFVGGDGDLCASCIKRGSTIPRHRTFRMKAVSA